MRDNGNQFTLHFSLSPNATAMYHFSPITEQEATATGVTLGELHGRSFVRIVQNRAYKKNT